MTATEARIRINTTVDRNGYCYQLGHDGGKARVIAARVRNGRLQVRCFDGWHCGDLPTSRFELQRSNGSTETIEWERG